MDDGQDDFGRRRRVSKGDSFRSGRSTSSVCATPRHNWRSKQWGQNFQDFSTEEDESTEDDSPFANEDKSDVGEIPMLCPPLESLSISKKPSEVKRPFKKGGLGLNIKLDLGALDETPEQEPPFESIEVDALTPGDKECDKQCTKVRGYLYLGSKTVAQNIVSLQHCRITHILNCVGFTCEEYFPDNFFYKTLWLHDTPEEDIICVLYNVFDFIEEVKEQANGRIFVHCSQGISRSAAIVIAYIMWRKKRGYEEVLQEIKSLRSITNPNLGFAIQLSEWQNRILDPNSSRQGAKIYRIAPHTASDPLHLVPKLVHNSNISALDTRGAFVIQVPNRLYVWKGKSCDKHFVAAADRAAFQLIRYEHAQGPIVGVTEGCEPSSLIETLKGGNEKEQGIQEIDTGRMVDAYRNDYELFSKARSEASSSTRRSQHFRIGNFQLLLPSPTTKR